MPSAALHFSLRRRPSNAAMLTPCRPLRSANRSLHAGTHVSLQRAAAPSQRSRRFPAAGVSSPTFRPPTQNLLSPFGAVLQGSSRGPRAVFAEPLDAWLAVLADSVPFYKDCLLVCPSTFTPTQVQHVWDRCRVHMPAAHVAPLRHRHGLSPGYTAIASRMQDPGGAQPLQLPAHTLPSHSGGDSVSAMSSAASQPTSALSARAPRPASSRSLPALSSPLEDVAPASLDLVVLASNVFAEEMLFDAPWHLSLAHRALRPHGVVAIVGHVADADVVAPDWAGTSCTECLEGMHAEAKGDLELLARDGVRHLPTSEAHERRLRRAVEVHETLRTAHRDVFFPFPSVRRRWFTSEYAMHPAQVAASFRAAPLYRVLYDPAGSLWRSVARHALLQERQWAADKGASHEGSGGGGDSDIFVDTAAILTNSTFGSFNGDNCEAIGSSLSTPTAAPNATVGAIDSWSPPGVQRRRGPVDPLDALQAILEAHTLGAATNSDRSRQARNRTPEPPLRVQMRHFVVTCSTRSINASLDTPSPPPPRLTSSRKARGGSLLPSRTGHPPLPLR